MLQRAAIDAEQVAESRLLRLGPRLAWEELVDRHDERRVGDDPWLAIDHSRQLSQRPHAVLRPRLRHHLPGGLRSLLVDLEVLEIARECVNVEAGVPDLEQIHRREVEHRLAVGADYREHRRPPVCDREVAVATRDLEACRKALHVPLQRPRQRLVEVVDVEHEGALGGSKAAEVGEMGVAAQLDLQTRARRGREIGGHDRRRAPVERERRREHPAVADRQELRHARDALLLEDPHRFPVRGRRKCSVAGSGNGFSRSPALGGALGVGEVGDDHRRSDRPFSDSECLGHESLPSGIRAAWRAWLRRLRTNEPASIDASA